MISEIATNILRLIFLLLVQGLVINELDLGTWFVPYVYILFIIKLPFETPKWMVLIFSFICGLLMDAFTNTPGLHISSCVFLGFIRPAILRLYSPRDGYEFGMDPSVSSMGLTWFIYYAGWMVISFNTWFFFMEVFSISSFFSTLLRIIFSTLLSLLMIVTAQYFDFGKRNNR